MLQHEFQKKHTGKRTREIALHAPLKIAAVLLAATAACPLAGQQNQFEASEAVFTVMAALNAAGMDHGVATSHTLRQTVRADSLST